MHEAHPDYTLPIGIVGILWIEAVKFFTALTTPVMFFVQLAIGLLTITYLIKKIRYINRLNKTDFNNDKENNGAESV